jgi:AraC-like DNA-binding protein
MRTQQPDTRSPAFPGVQPILVSQTTRSAFSVTRFSPPIAPGEEYLAKMDAEDAFVVLFQLRSHPAHDFSVDGKMRRVGPAPRSTLNIVNLASGDVCGRLLAPVDTLMFHLPRAAVDEIVDAAGAPKIDVLKAPEPWSTRDSVVDQIQPLLLDALTGLADGNSLLHDHMLVGLCAHFVQRYAGVQPRGGRARGRLAPWQARRTKELLSSSLEKAISLREIAQACRLSPDYLSRAFKATTGVTPHQWLQAHRVDQAKTMLMAPALSLADVARACGFADQSHLSRVFFRYTGSSPGAWRRSRRQEIGCRP